MDGFWSFVWGQLTPSALVAILVFVVGTWLKATIEKGEQHEFDRKLEALRSEMRRDEEAWKTALKARDDQLTAIRNGALTNLASRHAELDRRRLDAAERLWKATVAQKKFALALQFTKSLKMDTALAEAAKQNSDGQKMREFGDIIWKTAGMDNLKPTDELPDVDRLYVPTEAWNLFSIYRSIYGMALVQIAALKAGLGPDVLKDAADLKTLVKQALPHQSDFVDKYGQVALPYLIDEIENKIFATLGQWIGDRDADRSQLEAAASLSRAAEVLSSAAAAAKLEEANIKIPSNVQATIIQPPPTAQL